MEGEPTLQQKIDRIADFTTGEMSFKDKKELVDTFFHLLLLTHKEKMSPEIRDKLFRAHGRYFDQLEG